MKTFFFGHKNLAFAPFPPRLDGGLPTHADKRGQIPFAQVTPLLQEGSLLGTQLHDGHHAGSEQLQMDRLQDGSPDAPITAGSEASVWGRVETQRERQSPTSKAGCKAFENASQKQNSCFSLFEGLQGDNTADGYFCSHKTSRIRVRTVFRQMCSLKALLSLHNSEACSHSICSLNIPKP